uniref:Uncharacterized protein n=1 Tax=Tanacetum cinerariifolium TaxID=118510 RepID=A0A6L2MQY4_TANCI|nr:hypothetical protein [Tanacetum cinerariifolium]
MDMTTDQQVALDEALVPHASRLKIGKSNFCLKSDISSKESTLQLVYDATATVHHPSIRFKMDNKKYIVNLEYFREMLHIFPRLPGQTFNEPPFEEEILAFHRFLGHIGELRRLNDVEHKDAKKSNEMYYPRFTKVIIHYFMSKDLLIPMRNKVNWHYVRDDQMFTTIKLTKASVRKTKSSFDTTVTPPSTAAVGTKLSTSAKGKQPAKASKAKSPTALFKVAMTEAEQLKLATKRSLQQTYISQASGSGADEGTGDDDDEKGSDDQDDDDAQDNDENKDDDDQEEGDDDDDQEEGNDDQDSDEEDEEFIHPKLSIHDKDETRDEESFDLIPKMPKNSDDEGNDEENLGLNVGREEGQDEEDDEDELYRDVNINLEGRVVQMANVHTTLEFEDSHVTLTPVNPDGQQHSSSVSSPFVTSMLNPTTDAGIDSIFETTSQMDVQAPTTVAPLPLSAPTLTPSTIATISTIPQAPTPPTTALSTLLQDLPNFGSLFGFDHRLKTLEANSSKFVQTNQFARAVSSIPGIVQRYMDQRINKAVKVAIHIQSDRLRDEAHAENEEFLKNLDENIQKIIKEQVKEQVKTSYAVAADISKMELKKILIEKMEGNKSIYRSNEQRNLYKALVEAYESDKIILDTYGDTSHKEGKEPESASAPKEKATRSTGKSTQGSKSRQTSTSESAIVEEPMQTTHEMEEPLHPVFETCADDQPIAEPSQHPECFSQQKKPPTPDRDWNKTFSATHGSIQPWISELAKQTDSRSSFNELMDTLVDFSAFQMNRLKVDTLTSELLAGPTYELMKRSCKSLVELELFLEEVYNAITDQLDWINPEGQQYPHNLLKPLPLILNSRGRRVIPFDHFINNDLEYLRGGASSRKYTTSVTKTKAADYGHIKWIEDLVPRTMWIQEPESARDVYSKRRIIAVTELKIVEWHNYKHLDWIMVRRDDDKLYKFKEGDFNRLHIQDIEDMLLLLVQGKLTNLTVEERFAFNISLRMFTRSIVIQRRVEDLQINVENYQKKLNLTRPNTYRFDLKRKEACIAYSNPRGFIYQNKDKQNRLMRINELHKFSDGMLTNVRTTLDDHLKGIWMKYLPQTIWRKSDKEITAAMIQAIDKQLKTRRIMRNLERFICGRLYEGDFRMLQRTI